MIRHVNAVIKGIGRVSVGYFGDFILASGTMETDFQVSRKIPKEGDE